MENAEEEKYLGDILSQDGSNRANIEARVNKGKGIVMRIMSILNSIPFGKLYYEVAILLRNTLLVSSVLCNSEAWFNLTEAQLHHLESVDLMLLRNILSAPKSTPKEMFYLELGIAPFRKMIRQRRLNFLAYILRHRPESLIRKIFENQAENRTRKDWVTTVLRDLDVWGLNVSFDEIGKMNKTIWSNVTKQYMKHHAFKYLNEMNKKHSKVLHYKKPNQMMQTQSQVLVAFFPPIRWDHFVLPRKEVC